MASKEANIGKADGAAAGGDLQSLMEMGYEEAVAKEAVDAHPNSMEAAIEYLVNKEQKDSEKDPSKPKVAKSLVCNDCDPVSRFRNMRSAEIHAEKTGHTSFEESEYEIPPMSEAEKKQKIEELKARIAVRKKEREANEKVAAIAAEKERRRDGKQMIEMRDEMQKQKRLNEIALLKKEKEIEKQERQKLREKIAQDKGNVAAEKAKREGKDPNAAYHQAYNNYLKQFVEKITEKTPSERYDQTISAIDVLDARKTVLETLKKMLGNIVKDPTNQKFRKIRMNNPGFQKRLGKYRSAIAFFKVVGFEVVEEASIDGAPEQTKFLILKDDKLSVDIVQLGVTKLENALGL